MGMDVYGTKPTATVGEYFRRSVWGWRPLWDFCLENFTVVSSVEHGHSNDGDGLDAEDSKELASLIRGMLEDGSAKKYVDARQAYLDALPLDDCKYCDATGIRTDAVGVDNGMPTRELSAEDAKKLGRTHGTCNGCQGLGKVEKFETSYFLDLKDLTEFANFLDDCGGFKIY
jgi:hypothetical protein